MMGKQALSRPPAAHRARESVEPTNGALQAADGILYDENFASTYDPALNDAQMIPVSSNGYPTVDLSTQISESLSLDGLLAFEDYSSGLSNTLMASYDKMNRQSPPSWCTWTRQGVDLSVMSEKPVVQPYSNFLAILQEDRPHAQHSANVIIQSLRSLPTMMLRRETFPWFIHQHPQPLSKPTSVPPLPEALSTCMSISQMFASRTPETNSFLWRTIKAECRHFISQVRMLTTPSSSDFDQQKMYNMSKFELLSALQAGMIYLIIFIIDYSPENEENCPEIIQALRVSPCFYLQFL